MGLEEARQFEYDQCQREIEKNNECTVSWEVNEWFDEEDVWSSPGWCNWTCGDNKILKRVDTARALAAITDGKGVSMRAEHELFSFLKSNKDPVRQRAVRLLQSEVAKFRLDLDLAEVQRFAEEEQAADLEVAQKLSEFGMSVSELLEQWGPALEQLANEQARREEKAA